MSGIVIDVETRIDKAQRDLEHLNHSVSAISKSVGGVTAGFSKLAAALSIGGTLAALTQVDSTFTSIESNIKLVTGATKEFAVAYTELKKVADDTRSTFASTAEIFSKLGVATASMNVSSESIAKAAKSLQMAGSVAGGATEGFRAAMMQLGQGLGAGVLRGEEFNSIMEQALPVAQMIADSLGLSVGALREMANQGRLTSEVVFNALLSQSSAIEAKFKLIGPTLAQGMDKAKESFSILLNEISKSFGISSGLGAIFLKAGDSAARLADNISIMAANMRIFWREWSSRLSDAFYPFVFAFNRAMALVKTILAASGIGKFLVNMFYEMEYAATSVIRRVFLNLENTGKMLKAFDQGNIFTGVLNSIKLLPEVFGSMLGMTIAEYEGWAIKIGKKFTTKFIMLGEVFKSGGEFLMSMLGQAIANYGIDLSSFIPGFTNLKDLIINRTLLPIINMFKTLGSNLVFTEFDFITKPLTLLGNVLRKVFGEEIINSIAKIATKIGSLDNIFTTILAVIFPPLKALLAAISAIGSAGNLINISLNANLFTAGYNYISGKIKSLYSTIKEFVKNSNILQNFGDNVSTSLKSNMKPSLWSMWFKAAFESLKSQVVEDLSLLNKEIENVTNKFGLKINVADSARNLKKDFKDIFNNLDIKGLLSDKLASVKIKGNSLLKLIKNLKDELDPQFAVLFDMDGVTNLETAFIKIVNNLTTLFGRFLGVLGKTEIGKPFAAMFGFIVNSVRALEPVESKIENFAFKVIGHFREIWDKVIGNSWWTDTITAIKDSVNDLAGSVLSKIIGFAKGVINAFAIAYNAIKQVISDLRAGIAIIDFSGMGTKFAIVKDFFIDVKDKAISFGETVKDIWDTIKEPGSLKFLNSKEFQDKIKETTQVVASWLDSAKTEIKIAVDSEGFKSAVNELKTFAANIGKTIEDAMGNTAPQFAKAFISTFAVLLAEKLIPEGPIGNFIKNTLRATAINAWLSIEKIWEDSPSSSIGTKIGGFVGSMVGGAILVLIKNIPNILKQLLGFLGGFGQGFLESIFPFGGFVKGIFNLLEGMGLNTAFGLMGMWLFGGKLLSLMSALGLFRTQIAAIRALSGPLASFFGGTMGSSASTWAANPIAMLSRELFGPQRRVMMLGIAALGLDMIGAFDVVFKNSPFAHTIFTAFASAFAIFGNQASAFIRNSVIIPIITEMTIAILPYSSTIAGLLWGLIRPSVSSTTALQVFTIKIIGWIEELTTKLAALVLFVKDVGVTIVKSLFTPMALRAAGIFAVASAITYLIYNLTKLKDTSDSLANNDIWSPTNMYAAANSDEINFASDASPEKLSQFQEYNRQWRQWWTNVTDGFKGIYENSIENFNELKDAYLKPSKQGSTYLDMSKFSSKGAIVPEMVTEKGTSPFLDKLSEIVSRFYEDSPLIKGTFEPLAKGLDHSITGAEALKEAFVNLWKEGLHPLASGIFAVGASLAGLAYAFKITIVLAGLDALVLRSLFIGYGQLGRQITALGSLFAVIRAASFKQIANSVVDVVISLASIGGFIYAARAEWKAFTGATQDTLGGIKEVFSEVTEGATDLLGILKVGKIFLGGFLAVIIDLVVKYREQIGKFIVGFFNIIYSTIKTVVMAIYGVLKALFTLDFAAILSNFRSFGTALRSFLLAFSGNKAFITISLGVIGYETFVNYFTKAGQDSGEGFITAFGDALTSKTLQFAVYAGTMILSLRAIINRGFTSIFTLPTALLGALVPTLIGGLGALAGYFGGGFITDTLLHKPELEFLGTTIGMIVGTKMIRGLAEAVAASSISRLLLGWWAALALGISAALAHYFGFIDLSQKWSDILDGIMYKLKTLFGMTPEAKNTQTGLTNKQMAELTSAGVSVNYDLSKINYDLISSDVKDGLNNAISKLSDSIEEFKKVSIEGDAEKIAKARADMLDYENVVEKWSKRALAGSKFNIQSGIPEIQRMLSYDPRSKTEIAKDVFNSRSSMAGKYTNIYGSGNLTEDLKLKVDVGEGRSSLQATLERIKQDFTKNSSAMTGPFDESISNYLAQLHKLAPEYTQRVQQSQTFMGGTMRSSEFTTKRLTETKESITKIVSELNRLDDARQAYINQMQKASDSQRQYNNTITAAKDVGVKIDPDFFVYSKDFATNIDSMSAAIKRLDQQSKETDDTTVRLNLKISMQSLKGYEQALVDRNTVLSESLGTSLKSFTEEAGYSIPKAFEKLPETVLKDSVDKLRDIKLTAKLSTLPTPEIPEQPSILSQVSGSDQAKKILEEYKNAVKYRNEILEAKDTPISSLIDSRINILSNLMKAAATDPNIATALAEEALVSAAINKNAAEYAGYTSDRVRSVGLELARLNLQKEIFKDNGTKLAELNQQSEQLLDSIKSVELTPIRDMVGKFITDLSDKELVLIQPEQLDAIRKASLDIANLEKEIGVLAKDPANLDKQIEKYKQIEELRKQGLKTSGLSSLSRASSLSSGKLSAASEMFGKKYVTSDKLLEIFGINATIASFKEQLASTEDPVLFTTIKNNIKAAERQLDILKMSFEDITSKTGAVRDIFKTDITDKDLAKMPDAMVSGLIGAAQQFKIALDEALSQSGNTFTDEAKKIFGKLKEIERVGAFITFFKDLANSVEDSFTDGIQASLDKVKNGLPDLNISAYRLASMPNSGRDLASEANDLSMLKRIAMMSGLTDAQKTIINKFDRTNAPAVLAELKNAFGKDLDKVLQTPIDRNIEATNNLITSLDNLGAKIDSLAGKGKTDNSEVTASGNVKAEPTPTNTTARWDKISKQSLTETMSSAAASIGLAPEVMKAISDWETGHQLKIRSAMGGGSTNNLFNIKAEKGWKGDVSARPADDGGYFKAYSSQMQSINDFPEFLKRNPRYKIALTHVRDSLQFLQDLQDAGYAGKSKTWAGNVGSLLGLKGKAAVMQPAVKPPTFVASNEAVSNQSVAGAIRDVDLQTRAITASVDTQMSKLKEIQDYYGTGTRETLVQFGSLDKDIANKLDASSIEFISGLTTTIAGQTDKLNQAANNNQPTEEYVKALNNAVATKTAYLEGLAANNPANDMANFIAYSKGAGKNISAVLGKFSGLSGDVVDTMSAAQKSTLMAMSILRVDLKNKLAAEQQAGESTVDTTKKLKDLDDATKDFGDSVTEAANAARDAGKAFSESITSIFKDAFKGLLNQNKDEGKSVLGTFGSKLMAGIKDQVVNMFTDSFTNTIGLGKGGPLSKAFNNAGKGISSMFSGIGSGVKDIFTGNMTWDKFTGGISSWWNGMTSSTDISNMSPEEIQMSAAEKFSAAVDKFAGGGGGVAGNAAKAASRGGIGDMISSALPWLAGGAGVVGLGALLSGSGKGSWKEGISSLGSNFGAKFGGGTSDNGNPTELLNPVTGAFDKVGSFTADATAGIRQMISPDTATALGDVSTKSITQLGQSMQNSLPAAEVTGLWDILLTPITFLFKLLKTGFLGIVGMFTGDSFGAGTSSGKGDSGNWSSGGANSSSGGDPFSGMFGQKATGGRISGPGTGTSDSIPTLLSNGEFVINAKDAKENMALLESINNGKVIRRSAGGIIGSVAGVTGAVGSLTGSSKLGGIGGIVGALGNLVRAFGGDPADKLLAAAEHLEAAATALENAVNLGGLGKDGTPGKALNSAMNMDSLMSNAKNWSSGGMMDSIKGFFSNGMNSHGMDALGGQSFGVLQSDANHNAGSYGVLQSDANSSINGADPGNSFGVMQSDANSGGFFEGIMDWFKNIDFSSMFSGFATGGQIRGAGSATSDSIPAMLSNGEFIVNAAATAKNLPMLHGINNGEVEHHFLGALAGVMSIASSGMSIGQQAASMADGGGGGGAGGIMGILSKILGPLFKMIGPLAKIFPAIGNLFGGGGMLGSLFSSSGASPLGAAGDASLGSMFSGSSLGLSFAKNGGLFLASGGMVTGPGTSTSDSIPAMLSSGEYVIRASAVSKHRDLLHQINSGQVPTFATGGVVGAAAPVMATPTASNFKSVTTTAGANKGQQVINLNITGDISRQTKSEIYKMMPSIADGVNSQNKETGYKR
jgi:tape measure domain-containing protein